MPDDLAPQVSRQGSRKVTEGRSEAEESERSGDLTCGMSWYNWKAQAGIYLTQPEVS
jgi:hypothetical protein